MSAPPVRRGHPLRRLPTSWVRKLRARLGERDFWVIQAGLVVVTAFHVVFEYLVPQHGRTFASAFYHLPPTLYAVPVAYAGAVYGLEGGVSTGLASLLLTLPNIAIWHRADYAWAGQLSFMAAVVTLGLGLAVPTARERRERKRAERTAREASLVNAVSSAIVGAHDPGTAVDRALSILVEAFDLDGACVGLWRPVTPRPVVMYSRPSEGAVAVRLRRAVRDEIRPEIGVGPLEMRDGTVGMPLSAVGLSGALAMLPRAGRPLTGDDAEVVRAVGNQIALGIDNLVLQRDERDHLRSYVHMATQAQEDERLRIAREIHDDTVQLLTAIRRGLRDLALRAEGDLVDGPMGLVELAELSEATSQSLRKFARDLRPDTLDNLGLVPALRWAAETLWQRDGTRVTVVVEGEPRRLSPEVEVALFRIVQEALRNVERHADAATASLNISFNADTVKIAVRDDGRGFCVPAQISELPLAGKLGLVGMQERARLAGGTVDIRTHPGHGTIVSVEVPTSTAAPAPVASQAERDFDAELRREATPGK